MDSTFCPERTDKECESIGAKISTKTAKLVAQQSDEDHLRMQALPPKKQASITARIKRLKKHQ